MKTIVLKTDPEDPHPQVIREAAEAIRRGELVAFPTETVYGLGADAMNPQAVERVFEIKGRPADNPLPVQVPSADGISLLVAEVPPSAMKLMSRFWPGPLTIIFKASPSVSKLATANTGKIGIRVPDHAVALALIREARTPIVAPSANKSEMPPPKTAEEVLAYFDGKVEIVLDAGPSPLKVASTVVDVTEMPPRILRAGPVSEAMLMDCLKA